MSKLLITEEEANILLVSKFISESEELNYVYNLLNKYNRLEDGIIKDNTKSLEIKRRVNDWVRVSLGEWHVDNTRSPHEITNDEKNSHKFKCAFCKRNLKSEVYFASNRLGNTITLGSSCVRKLGDNEFMASAHIANGDKEQLRYEHLIKRYPHIEDVMNDGRNKALSGEYIASQKLVDMFRAKYDSLKKYTRSYLRSGKFDRKSRNIQNDLNDYYKVCSMIKDYQKECTVNPNFHLDKETISNEQRIDKEKTDRIIKKVRENNGIITNNLASNIINVPYLEKVSEVYSHVDVISNLKITVVNNGLFSIIFIIDSTPYKFRVSSLKIVNLFGFPYLNTEIPSGLNVAKSIGDSFEPDDSTKLKLFEDSIQILSDNLDLSKLSFDTNEVWNNVSSRQGNWFDKKYGENTIFKNKSGNVLLISQKDMINLAMWTKLELKSIKEVAEFVSSKSAQFNSKDELFNDIRNSYDIFQSFN
ncbi:hypothetical protein [Companilactobacillus kedongensis]|uniref:hypothetical protein n=1 Tax=Companilactobacillus kedongensis TaxID=2486004 RepID=UPI000F7A27CB|nr:hypothetical protein [Companilactobacillus kedongensis]